MIKAIPLFVVFSVLLCCSTVSSQDNSVWISAKTEQKSLFLKRGVTQTGFKLDIEKLKSKLESTPKRGNSVQNRTSGLVIDFPVASDKYGKFQVTESSVLSDELEKKYPNIKSYVGVSAENPLQRIYFSIDALGFHGVIRDGNKRTYINPTGNQKDLYYLAQKSDFKNHAFECDVIHSKGANGNDHKNHKTNTALRPVDDSLLRTYRLALACSGEYAQFQLSAAGFTNGTVAQQKAIVLSAMNTTITRVNSVYENDLAITLQLVANNDKIIFLDPDTDGLTNESVDKIINQEIQDLIDTAIGTENYDIGHVFIKVDGGSGKAVLSSVCTSGKAKGVTGSKNPVGDPFDIDYASHEIGHQFGATHTFNNSCGSNRSPGHTVEPGSGSTIMAYAGICPENVQGGSDAYFHAISISQIWDNITRGVGTCATTTSISNQPPVIESLNSYTIPVGTAFVLDGNAKDPDGDILTYTWEQQDNEISPQPPKPQSEKGPMFRSRAPSLSSKRYFPEEIAILNNNLAPTWEVIPTVSRDLNFSLLVRDNNPEGGQTARADIIVKTVDTGNPFAVTSQNTVQTLQGGSVHTIEWNVANTDELPIGNNFVDIYLLIDNNFGNLIPLAEKTKNDGLKQVVIPGNITTSNARIMIKAVDNIYFALNKGVLKIQPSNFALIFNSLEHSVCQPNDRDDIHFTYKAYNGFNQTVTFTSEDVPNGLTVSFDKTKTSTSETVITANLKGINNLALGSNNFTIVATASGGEVKKYPIELSIYSASIDPIALKAPANNATGVPIKPVLSWIPHDNANEYKVEVSTKSDFSTVLLSNTIPATVLQLTNLKGTTTYYWRVKPINPCGEGTFSSAFSFTTINISCDSYTNSTAIAISDLNTHSVSSKIEVLNNGTIHGATVFADISHTWLADISIYLISPSGTVVSLLVNQCGDKNRNLQATFTDEGSALFCSSADPSVSGAIKPAQPLSVLNGEPTKGIWTLKVEDSNMGDGGSLNTFALNLCINGDFQVDTDKDGVLDANDHCPNTPKNTKVDINGCKIFNIAENNYTITITDQPCSGSSSGSIDIKTIEAHNYTAILKGNGITTKNSFTESTSFSDLPTGTYTLCFYVDEDHSYKQCFSININEPELLTVFSNKSADDDKISLELSGGNQYIVTLNGVISKTNRDHIELPLKKGVNTLKIHTDKTCQGSYQELIVTPGNISVYPNSFQDELTVYTGSKNTDNRINLYDATGRFVKNMVRTADHNGKINLTLGDLASGMYFIQVENELGSNTVKAIKQ